MQIGVYENLYDFKERRLIYQSSDVPNLANILDNN